MNYILIANTTPPMADYYGLGVTLIALILIIFGIRGIIRGSREPGDDEENG